VPIPVNSRPISRRSARTLVFEQLRDWIETGVIEPGEVIRDGEVAERLGVSRTPVREALQKLEHQGAIVVVPGKETRVAAASGADAELLYPPVAVLHALATELATPRITSRHIEAMKDANERMLEAFERGDYVGAREADVELHAVFLQLADNAYLTSALEALQIHVRRLEVLYFSHFGGARSSYLDHLELIDAVTAGDALRASEIVRNNYRLPVSTGDSAPAGDAAP
jgi:DNA-binding GntR family transcriptional regulator